MGASKSSASRFVSSMRVQLAEGLHSHFFNLYYMLETFILLILCVCFSLSVYITLNFINKGNLKEKIIAITLFIVLGILLSIAHFFYMDHIRQESVQKYIESIDNS